MHATTSQLIARRDGDPIDATVVSHIDACADCQSQLDELTGLRDGFRQLPEEPLPDGAWERIDSAMQLERRTTSPLPLWLAVAASVFAALLLGILLVQQRDGNGAQQAAQETGVDPAIVLAELQDRSRYLEQMLDAVHRGSSRVTSLRTAGTVTELEDSIALIDYHLSQPAGADLTHEQRRSLWEQRVDLLESLVTVRYAQARANSI